MWLYPSLSFAAASMGTALFAGPTETPGLGSTLLGMALFTALEQHQLLWKPPKTCTSITPSGAQTARDFYKPGENAPFVTLPYVWDQKCGYL